MSLPATNLYFVRENPIEGSDSALLRCQNRAVRDKFYKIIDLVPVTIEEVFSNLLDGSGNEVRNFVRGAFEVVMPQRRAEGAKRILARAV